MKIELQNTTEKPPASIREAIARLKTIIAESEADDEKRKLYFGYFETSDGDI